MVCVGFCWFVLLFRRIYAVIKVLLDSGIPHNMVILWGGPFNQQDGGESGQLSPTVRAILVPRKPVYGKWLICSFDILIKPGHLHMELCI